MEDFHMNKKKYNLRVIKVNTINHQRIMFLSWNAIVLLPFKDKRFFFLLKIEKKRNAAKSVVSYQYLHLLKDCVCRAEFRVLLASV